MTLTPARTARAMHGVVEPIHATLYFARQVQDRLGGLGLDPRTSGYFASRAAPFGAVEAGVVSATFFNFNPLAVQMFVPACWDATSPQDVLEARAAGWQQMWDDLGAKDPGLQEAVDLAQEAASACDLPGRPLAAANAAVPVPGTPFAALMQHLTVVREHRGDGHVAVLTAAGLAPTEVLSLYAAWQGKVSRRFLQASRAWDDAAWGAGVASLAARGWVDGEGELTDAGRAARDHIEAETDRLAVAPWAALGEERSRRLFDLLRPVAVAIDEGGVYPKPAGVPASFEAALDA